jgi:hypothetical protein
MSIGGAIIDPNDKFTVYGNMAVKAGGTAYFVDCVANQHFVALGITAQTQGFGSVLNMGYSLNDIGYQTNTLYVRANDDIRYYYRGAHSDTQGDPGVNGTGLFTVKGATGNVAIGSFSNPQDRLHILGDLRVYNGLNTADSGGIIKFGTSNNPTFGEMSAVEGVYFSSNATDFAGGLAFFTRSNNATSNTTTQERMRITHYGSVGIGTTTPQDRLHVLGDMRVYNGLNTANSGGAIRFGTSNNPTFSEMASIQGVYFSSNATKFAGGLAFSTRSNNAAVDSPLTERMRISHTGQVLIGMTSTACNYIFMVSSDSAAKPGTNTWTIASDERIKENIVSANVGICYSNVKNIPLKYYKWRDDIYTEEQVRDRRKLGWIAQDVEIVFPKAVDIAPMFGYPDCRSLNNDQIIASMYGAVQHIQNTLEAQADRERQQRRLVTVDLDATAEKKVVNAAVTGPRCDVVHRGRATLANGQAQIDLDGECGFSPGTFAALFHNVQFFLQNVTGFSRLRGEVTESILTILCENASGIDQISWMVIAERKDSYVLGGADGRTNAAGYLIPELISQ